jgi:hypothetical protein
MKTTPTISKNRIKYVACSLILGASFFTVAWHSAYADDPAPRAAMTMNTCGNSYTVVGAIYDGEEAESIDNYVFTDREPFECALASATQTVVFSFNSSATDPVTGCTYNIVRKHKATGLTLGATETLECGDLERHYEVIATPATGDPDCSGLSVIDVDPKINITKSTSQPTGGC